MITGEYDAAQAYRAFNAGLLSEKTPCTGDIVLSSEKAYSNVFHKNGGSYKLTGVTRNGKPLQDNDTVTVTCLAMEEHMTPLLQDEAPAFERGEDTVKNFWSKALSDGSVVLATPENYITLE